MELDSRIKEGKRPLTCFDIEQAKEFLGKECYFSNCKSHYKNLSAFEKFVSLTDYCIGELTAIMDLGDRVFDVDQQCNEFRYCLPCEWVKEEKSEPKYRPYTLTEFVNTYSLGDEVVMRSKNNPTVKHVLFIECEQGRDDVHLGQYWYTFMILFNNYDIYTDEGWKPFGVEE